MDKYEAKLAVDLNAICVSGGIRYYAYGMEYINPIDKPAYESIILHNLRANSITHADRERTTVEEWKAPPEYVEKRLALLRKAKHFHQSRNRPCFQR